MRRPNKIMPVLCVKQIYFFLNSIIYFSIKVKISHVRAATITPVRILDITIRMRDGFSVPRLQPVQIRQTQQIPPVDARGIKYHPLVGVGCFTHIATRV